MSSAIKGRGGGGEPGRSLSSGGGGKVRKGAAGLIINIAN